MKRTIIILIATGAVLSFVFLTKSPKDQEGAVGVVGGGTRQENCRESSESMQTRHEREYASGCAFGLESIYSRKDDKNSGISTLAVVGFGDYGVGTTYTIGITSSDFLCEDGDENCSGGDAWYRLSVREDGKEIESIRMDGVVLEIWKTTTGAGEHVIAVRGWSGGNSLYMDTLQLIRGSGYGVAVGPQVAANPDIPDPSEEDVLKEIEYGLRIHPVWTFVPPAGP